MNQAQQNRGSLPPLIVSKDNYKRIIDLAIFAEDRAPEVASVLIAEMERARIGLPHEAVPGSKLESGRRWPASDPAAAERRAEQMLAARSFRALAVDSRAMSAA